MIYAWGGIIAVLVAVIFALYLAGKKLGRNQAVNKQLAASARQSKEANNAEIEVNSMSDDTLRRELRDSWPDK